MQRLAAGNAAALFHTDFVACNSYAQGMEAAAAMTCPTLFLLAQQDQMTPGRASAALIAAIPTARVERLASCGHALMAEQPDAVLASLFGFAVS